jgi:IS30 family transposase
MACHDQIAHLFSDGVFFAYPGRPWERPSNENTNGLLRQYFPKRTDLSVHGAQDLEAVEQRLNNRPRKTLGWLTPTQVFAAGLPSP